MESACTQITTVPGPLSPQGEVRGEILVPGVSLAVS